MQVQEGEFDHERKWDELREENPFGVVKPVNAEQDKKKKLKKTLTGVGVTAFLIFLLVIIVFVISKVKKPNSDALYSDSRLPSWQTPVHYNLTIQLDTQRQSFEGEEIIDLILTNQTFLLILNSKQLTIREAYLRKLSSFDSIDYFSTEGFLPYNNLYYYTDNDYIVLKFDELIIWSSSKAPTYLQLKLSFSGKVRQDMQGLYLSTYLDPSSNLPHSLFSTFFEPLAARYVFPCKSPSASLLLFSSSPLLPLPLFLFTSFALYFLLISLTKKKGFDEPSFKANFTLSVITSENFPTVISNMPEVARFENKAEKLIQVKFGTTPKMSTYLLCFVISEFQSIEDNSGVVPVRVFASPQKVRQGQFAASFASKLVGAFNTYFGVKVGALPFFYSIFLILIFQKKSTLFPN